MKKCTITVEKTYQNGKGVLKSSHSIELNEKELSLLCSCIIEVRTAYECCVLRHLYDMLRAY